MSQLDALALKHGTDKASNSHNYTPLYERYLTTIRNSTPSGVLLELGWGGHEDPDLGGNSARMWRDWLPEWKTLSIDNEAKNITDKGLWFRQGSQADPEFIASVVTEFGEFDVVIDDASHVSSLSITSFGLLWPHLKPGGIYVVEDTHSSYHDWYYGKAEADENPNTYKPTMMQFLKSLADEANFHGDGDWDLFPEKYALGVDVEAVHFHFNIAFIEKRL